MARLTNTGSTTLGLDSVERVMPGEKHFQIEIPDSEASELVTVASSVEISTPGEIRG